jgi:Subtilase family
MRDLAEAEKPEKDDRGFPVRRGEIVALDMSDAAIASATAKGFGIIERTPLSALDSVVTRLSTPKDMDAQSALATMRSLDAKGSYDLTHYYGASFTPQGMRTAALPHAKAPVTKGSLKIGMIDTKVTAHQMLANTQLQQRDFTPPKVSSPSEHGTAIASLLSSDGAGQIYAANVFQGSAAKPYTSADALVRALNWMVEQNVVVINISLVGPRNTILDALVARTIGKGHIIVAAAGNGGPTAPPAYPAALPDVVAVTAVDSNLRVYRYANQGRYITVSARGVDVTAAAPGGGISSYSGTSFATPHIAAWMARCAKTLNATARKKCMAAMEKSAKDLGAPGKDEVYGLGYIS